MAWLRFFRVRLLPTAISNALLGAFLGELFGQPVPKESLPILLAAVASLYLFGMGLNDYRDRLRDRDLHPERPLPAGQISAAMALLALLALLAAAMAGMLFLGGTSLVWGLATLTCILVYDLAAKDLPTVGPVTMGLVRFSVVNFGASSGAEELLPPLPLLLAALLVAFYVALLTHYSLEEEQRRMEVLKRRARWFFWGTVIGVSTLTNASFTEWELNRVLPLAIPVLWLGAWALRPLLHEPVQPELVTFRSLLGLPLLDLTLLLTYDLYIPASISLGLWLLMRPIPLPHVQRERMCS